MRRLLAVLALVPLLAWGQRPATDYPPLKYDPATGALVPATANGHTIGGTTFQPLDPDLTALAGLNGTNTIYYRSAANTWSPVTIGNNLTFSGGTLSAAAGLPTQTGHNGEYLTTNGTSASWAAIPPPSDTVFGSSWNGVTTIAPSKNAIYDYVHLFDTDDNGKVNVLDLAAGIPKTNASGVLSLAVAGTDYVSPSGTLALGGFGSITGRIANANLPLGAQLYDNAGAPTISVDGGTRKLLDPSGQWSIEWDARHLTNEFDVDLFVWSGNNFTLNDASSNPVLQGDRTFYDESAKLTYNSQTRRFYGTDGTTVVLDYSDPTGVSFGATSSKVRQNLGLLSARNSSQFSKTNSTLADVTGLSINVSAGKAYAFRAVLYSSVPGDGGWNVAMGGTATATSFVQVISWQDPTNDWPAFKQQRITTFGGSWSDAGYDFPMIEINGTIVVNTGGTLTVKFAQAGTDATPSVILANSTLVAQEVP